MSDAPDREDRDRARFRLDASVVVEAGAGTGKTTLLTDRMLFLLLGWAKPVPPAVERVVALTFTEKAAGEIKVRLSDRLGELAALLAGVALEPKARERAERTRDELRERFGVSDAEALARARAALEDLDKAPIGTIHSFCAQLLRLHPLEAGVDPGFRVDEGEAFEQLFDSEWARWLDAELGERPPRRQAWLELLERCPLEELEAMARELCSEKLSREGLDAPDPAAAGALREWAAQARTLGGGRGKPRGKILEALAAIDARLSAAADAAAAADPALDAAEPPEPANASWPKDWAEDEAGAALYARLRAVAAGASPRAEALTRRGARLLAPFAESFAREYARRGWVSFDGLLRRARDLLRDRPRVREELKRRFAAVLIDEFQDTDPLQGELLLYLAEREGASARRWQDVEPAPGRVFVVGDPKQSIYRFRGADISAYEGFVGRLTARGALVCDLRANFRSVPGVVGPVNEAFARVMKPEPGAQPPYKPILPARAPGPELPAVELVALRDPADGADAAFIQRAEAGWIAAWIAERAASRPLKDFAVLLRSSTALPAFLDAFKRAGLPYAVEIERFFYESPEAVDFMNLLRALDEPGDRVALAGLLRSPLAALGDDGLLSLARAEALDYRRDPPAGALPPEESRRASELYAALRSLRARVGRRPLAELAAAALEETCFVELAARAYHGQQTVSNLLKLKRLAVEASDSRGATLKEFAARVREAARESRREGESPLADERLEAVRVMSVHKSKGLEFPVVIAANLSGRPGGANEKPSMRLDPLTGRAALRLGAQASAAMALADAREKEMERRESVRLLYVAMTRAREKLLLVGREKTVAGALSGHLLDAGVWPRDGRVGSWPTLLVDAGEVPEPAPRAAAPARAALEPETAVASWERRAALRQAAAPARARTATAYLREPPKRPAAEEGEMGSPAGAEIGQLCHRVLQDWDFRAGGELAPAVERARALLERRAPGPRWGEAAKEAGTVLASFLKSPAAKALAKAEILGRETPFVYADGGVMMRGAADLIVREDGKLVVYDFKSERVDEKTASEAKKRYAQQGRVYAEALKKAWGEEPEFRLLFLRRPEL